MIMEYESLPATCEAWQVDSRKDSWGMPDGVQMRRTHGEIFLWVEKSQAFCLIGEGDYVVLEPGGLLDKPAFYPCAKDVFEARWAELQ